jgi:hypothetical protein
LFAPKDFLEIDFTLDEPSLIENVIFIKLKKCIENSGESRLVDSLYCKRKEYDKLFSQAKNETNYDSTAYLFVFYKHHSKKMSNREKMYELCLISKIS